MSEKKKRIFTSIVALAINKRISVISQQDVAGNRLCRPVAIAIMCGYSQSDNTAIVRCRYLEMLNPRHLTHRPRAVVAEGLEAVQLQRSAAWSYTATQLEDIEQAKLLYGFGSCPLGAQLDNGSVEFSIHLSRCENLLGLTVRQRTLTKIVVHLRELNGHP